MRQLSVVLDGRPSTLERHPDDGFIRADPAKIGPATRRALRALVLVFCPPPPAPQLADAEDLVERSVLGLLPYMSRLTAFGFVLAIHLLEWAPIWRFVAFSRLSRLPRARAEAVADGLSASRSPLVRTIALGVRGVVQSTYYDQPEVHAALDYAPIPFMQGRIALRERIVAGGETTPADLIGPFSEVTR